MYKYGFRQNRLFNFEIAKPSYSNRINITRHLGLRTYLVKIPTAARSSEVNHVSSSYQKCIHTLSGNQFVPPNHIMLPRGRVCSRNDTNQMELNHYCSFFMIWTIMIGTFIHWRCCLFPSASYIKCI